jgi:general stress protein YciG
MQTPTTNEKQPENREADELRTEGPPAPAAVAPTRKPRGFAAIDRNLVKEIARKGGKAAHAAGTAHEFTSEEARVAGRKGGQATHANRRRPADVSAAQK